jgi:hypothetical protein
MRFQPGGYRMEILDRMVVFLQGRIENLAFHAVKKHRHGLPKRTQKPPWRPLTEHSQGAYCQTQLRSLPESGQRRHAGGSPAAPL